MSEDAWKYKWKSLIIERRIEFTPAKDPSAWVQWKGTNVCADVNCSCGNSWHIDGDFYYFVQCPECQRVYEMNGNIELIELTDERDKKFAMDE
ncbi:MAG TPA: hypothetical protein VMW24_18725 [Sedimentisphaerales bacterium]|nr:hypothetical protein [Sedimentisphaerales bacterium]